MDFRLFAFRYPNRLFTCMLANKWKQEPHSWLSVQNTMVWPRRRTIHKQTTLCALLLCVLFSNISTAVIVHTSAWRSLCYHCFPNYVWVRRIPFVICYLEKAMNISVDAYLQLAPDMPMFRHFAQLLIVLLINPRAWVTRWHIIQSIKLQLLVDND